MKKSTGGISLMATHPTIDWNALVRGGCVGIVATLVLLIAFCLTVIVLLEVL